MMNRHACNHGRRAPVSLIAIIVCMTAGLLLGGPEVYAAEPSVMRVLVTPSAGQMSLVVEMTEEARRVSTQQTSATVLMLEAGPIASPLKRQILKAPSGLSLLEEVAVDEGTTNESEHVLRLRVTMRRTVPSSVRVVGRRIYLDFMVPDAPMPVASVAAATAGLRSGRDGDAKPTLLAAKAVNARQVVNGAVAKFEEIQPFLVSATTSATPNAVVLGAVADAITSVQQSLHGVQSPAATAPPFQMLVSAVTLAAEAVNADFHGDRGSKAKQALAVFAAAKAQLQ
jgi:hypothetical protein